VTVVDGVGKGRLFGWLERADVIPAWVQRAHQRNEDQGPEGREAGEGETGGHHKQRKHPEQSPSRVPMGT
jgi:hypothetical protein